MAKTLVVEIRARIRVPDGWRPENLSVDKNTPILMEYSEISHDFSFLSVPVQPRIMTIQHSIQVEK